jgi:hypothetical protein
MSSSNGGTPARDLVPVDPGPATQRERITPELIQARLGYGHRRLAGVSR